MNPFEIPFLRLLQFWSVFFNVKALLDISGEANQRLLPIGCQWSTTRPVKCWTFEGPWTALSWWSCDLLVLFGHFFSYPRHLENQNDNLRGWLLIERIHQQIHEETTQNRYVPCTISTHTNLTSHIFSYVIISSHDCPHISTVHHKIIAKSSSFPSKLPVAPPFPWPSRSVARPNAMTLCPWLGWSWWRRAGGHRGIGGLGGIAMKPR